MDREFDGQVGVVTGAAGGLGRAVSRMLAERGATVFMVDMDREGLQRQVEIMRGEGLSVVGTVLDLGNEDEYPALRTAIERHGDGRLDILVNNAGGWRYGRASEISMTDWDWTFRTNVTAPFLASRALMGLMVARRYGRIVNVASADAHRAKPLLPHYAAAKAAVVSLTKSLAEELAPHQVLVNAVSPGAIATDIAKGQDWFHERIKSIPVGRAAEPVDIGEVILFLASPRNRFIVGETVMATGGLLMV